MDFQEQVDVLVQVGLTSIQAKVFLSLSQHAALTVNQIAKSAKMPSELVYRTMPKLEELGLVEKTVTVPQKFQTIPTRTAINILLKHKKEAYDEAQTRMRQLLLELTKRNEIAPQIESEEPRIVYIPVGKPVAEYRKKLIGGLKKSLDHATIDKRVVVWMNDQEKILKRLLARGVQIRIVIEESKARGTVLETIREFENLGPLEYRFYPRRIPAIIAVCDEKELLMSSRTRVGYYDSPLYWSNNESFVEMAKVCYEAIWNNSIRGERRREAQRMELAEA
ncbi:MAG: TrmB family transcriptional regulator [Candidatus Bathyarchaeia archaeon]